jgi:membrane protease YdiL (CAAX protease family)
MRYPILTGLALFVIALIFRLTDIFLLRLDERLGEIILSKLLACLLILLFLWLVGRPLRAIGMHAKALGPSLLIGSSAAILALFVGYTLELAFSGLGGSVASLRIAAIDPKAGVSGGVMFAMWLVAGNFVNSFAEEGLFRGIMVPLFRIRLFFWRANWLQSILFGAWHLPWVLKWYQTGVVQTPNEVAMGTISNFLPQMLLGLVWGYMLLRTGNLWSCWTAHTLTNSALNLVHVTSAGALDTGLPLRMAAYTIASLFAMSLIDRLARRFELSEMQPWNRSGSHRDLVRSPQT